MKKLLFLCCLTHSLVIVSQVPGAFKYQAVARDASQQIIYDQGLDLRISILKEPALTQVYSEVHNTSSNSSGIINLNIGHGNELSGLFEDIDWSEGPYQIKVELDLEQSGEFLEMGTSPFLSVPYALIAEEVLNKDDADADPSNEIQSLSYDADNNTLALEGNEIINLDVIPVKTDSTLTGDGTVTNPLSIGASGAKKNLIVDADGDTWVNVESSDDNDQIVFQAGEGSVIFDGRRLSLSHISQNVLIGEQAGASDLGEWMPGHPNANVFIGHRAGQSNTVGNANVFIGNQSGRKNTGGIKNVFVGLFAGFNNQSNQNTFIGSSAGLSNDEGSNNTFVGNEAGWNNMNASDNMFVGSSAGFSNASGTSNSFLGYLAGGKNISGIGNNFFGRASGANHTQGNYNLFNGSEAGLFHETGSFNTMVGALAGRANETGEKNVFIGYQAGRELEGNGNVIIGHQVGAADIETESNLLMVHNTGSTKPLIFGRFDQRFVKISGQQRIEKDSDDDDPHIYLLEDQVGNSPARIGFANSSFPNKPWILEGRPGNLSSQARFDIHFDGEDVFSILGNGDMQISGSLNQISDRRLKSNVMDLSIDWSQFMGLRSVNYVWKKELGKSERQKVGFIAQEIEKIFPEFVIKDENGLLSVDYVSIIPVLVTAIQDLRKEIDALKKGLK